MTFIRTPAVTGYTDFVLRQGSVGNATLVGPTLEYETLDVELDPEPLLEPPLALVLLEPPLLQAASTRLVAAAATTAAAARLFIIEMLISPGGSGLYTLARQGYAPVRTS